MQKPCVCKGSLISKCDTTKQSEAAVIDATTSKEAISKEAIALHRIQLVESKKMQII